MYSSNRWTMKRVIRNLSRFLGDREVVSRGDEGEFSGEDHRVISNCVEI